MDKTLKLKLVVAKVLYDDSHYNDHDPPSWEEARGIIQGRYLERADKVLDAIIDHEKLTSLT